MTSEGERNDADGIDDVEHSAESSASVHRGIRCLGNFAQADGDDPDNGAVAYGGDCAGEGDAGEGIEIWELREDDGEADEDEVPFDGR